VDPRRIAVLPGFGLGDAVFTIPALRALRARFPEAAISVLGASWLGDLVGPPRGPASGVVPLPDPARRWLAAGEGRGSPELEACLDELRALELDLAVQLFGGGRTSNPFVASIGARETLGLRAPGAPALERTVPYVYWQSEVVRHLEVVALVDARPVELDPSLAVLPADGAAAAPLVAGVERPLALLVPGAGDGRRRWPLASYAELAGALAGRGLSVALIGGVGDRDLAASISNLAPVALLDLTGRTSISALIGLAASAAVVVGNDTGPTHVAAAAGAPTVELFWVGNLINGGRLRRARYRPLLSWRLDCPVCGRSTIADRCDHDASFVDGIGLEAVLDALDDLLERQPALERAARPLR